MNELTETQKAYIAGIVDGEGCINIARNYKPHGVSVYHGLQVWIVNCDKGLIDYLTSTVGYGYVSAQAGRKSNHRTLYGWHLGQRLSHRFLVDIYDYLVIKKDQADVALSFMKTFDNVTMGHGYTTPKSLIKQREEYLKLLRRLKRESTIIDDLPVQDKRIAQIDQMHTNKQLSLF